MIAKRPEKRFQAMTEVIEAIDAMLETSLSDLDPSESQSVRSTLKQIFESVVSASESGFMDGNDASPHRVGLIEFPSAGIWSIVYVTGEAAGAIKEAQPSGETDLVAVFMPTGMVPPTGFVCFVPRRNVIFLPISLEDAAKTVVSAGMFMPEQQAQIKEMIRQATDRLNESSASVQEKV